MLTRKLIMPGALAAALLLGMFSQKAASTEEIVVYGSEALARVEARRAMFRAELDEYIRSVGEQIKTRLQDDAKRVAAPKLEVASSETPIRG